MKKLIIAALLLVSISSFAQENQGNKVKPGKGNKDMKSPEGRAEARLKKMTSELNLDANQQVQMKQIILDQSAKMEAMKAERMANNDAKPSKEERKAEKAKRVQESAAMDANVKAILNPTQFLKYKEIEEANKAKMKEKIQEKGGKKANEAGGE